MNEESQLEIVELGNAKQATKGPRAEAIEQNQSYPVRPV